jgi:hypothetical protein
LGEVLVAGALLCLIVMSVINLFPSAMVALSHSNQNQQAHLLAQDALEAMSARPFSSLVAGPQALTEIQAPPGFAITVEVGPVGEYPLEHLKKVSAMVSWSTRRGPKSLRQDVYLQPAHP